MNRAKIILYIEKAIIELQSKYAVCLLDNRYAFFYFTFLFASSIVLDSIQNFSNNIFSYCCNYTGR